MLLEIKNVNKHYGEKRVLHDVSFNATSGRTLGLLGRNGHGKTTTMKIMMGIIYGDSGEVMLDGAPLKKSTAKFGYLPEERGLYQKVTVLEQMSYFGKLRGMSFASAKKSAIDLLLIYKGIGKNVKAGSGGLGRDMVGMGGKQGAFLRGLQAWCGKILLGWRKKTFGKKMWITWILGKLGNCGAVAFLLRLRVFKAGVDF